MLLLTEAFVENGGGDEEEADRERDPDAGDPGQFQAVAKHSENEQTEKRSENRAFAAGDLRSPSTTQAMTSNSQPIPASGLAVLTRAV